MTDDTFVVRDTKDPTVIISAKVRPAIREDLKRVAKANNLTVSNVAAQCIEFAMARIEGAR